MHKSQVLKGKKRQSELVGENTRLRTLLKEAERAIDVLLEERRVMQSRLSASVDKELLLLEQIIRLKEASE